MSTTSESDNERCQFVIQGLNEVGYQPADPPGQHVATWRTSPMPFYLSSTAVEWFRELGCHLHRFTIASNDLYLDSAKGRQPGWVCEYLDQGKPPALVQYQQIKGLRQQYPTVLRPDVIPTTDGMTITELDSVPGGMGVTGRLAELYAELGHQIITDNNSIPEAFADMIRAPADNPSPRLAIVVSAESESYRAEMTWLGRALSHYGIEAVTARPDELRYSDDGVFIGPPASQSRVDIVYRFFELFDLPNIPNIDSLMSLNRARKVAVVPPFRPLFEEKIWIALLQHPVLSTYWRHALGDKTYSFLSGCFPPTWIMDPGIVPPYATIPNLYVSGHAVNSWQQLRNLGRSERRLVIKPSGFSELAWGSRGVVVGHDISTGEWNAALENGLNSFSRTPHILQEFRGGRHFEGRFYDHNAGAIRTIACRVRLCPYYFVIGNEVTLASILATMCPLDKKKIHGMPDAILVPCAVDSTAL
jgi:hypothetical protein